MIVFYLWIKAMKEGSMMYGTACALFYFYMVAAWGGYVFITNVIPMHVFALILMGRFNNRLYVAFSSYYIVGTLASCQVPFVGNNPVTTSEHMAPLGVFGLLQLVAFAEFVRSLVPSKQFKVLLRGAVVGIFFIAFSGFVLLSVNGKIAPWTGRFYSLWDTGYAKKHMPLVASVSEHQPPAWPAFFFDLEMLIFLFPAGIFFLFRQLRDEHVFVIIYAVTCSYFASVMVRLMLTLTPVVCVSAAIAISTLLDTYLDPQEPETPADSTKSLTEDLQPTVPASPANGKKGAKKAGAAKTSAGPVQIAKAKARAAVGSVGVYGLDTRILVSVYTLVLLLVFVLHCTFVTSTAYSSPSVVLASRNPDGSQHIIDDFREAYYWLRQNTPVDANVMSWWDYGYQIAGMADRPTLVDNNTWNNTHIATVGRMMSTSEEKSEPYLRKHDVDYVLVIFGGLLGFSGDDINKFLWMIRISGGIWPDEIKEAEYFTKRGEYSIGDTASETMKESLMYKMSYYRFNELFGGRAAMDRVRGQQTATISPKLDILDEAFTSENWIVRIYQVKKEDPLGRPLPAANAFEAGKRRDGPIVAGAASAGGARPSGKTARKGKKSVT
jgi:dolichyl-diphosphooligosaccharide--protein glycosyltransferase